MAPSIPVLEINIRGAVLRLLPERAAYFAAERTLLVADVHLGKAQAFRRLGVPVPEGTTAGTLARLTRAIEATGAARLVVLGDLMHAALATRTSATRGEATRQAVAEWRRAHPALDVLLVRGNHDARAGALPAEWAVEVVDGPWPLGPFELRHEPDADTAAPSRYILAGHLHPAVHLGGRGPGRLKLPCFHFGAAVGVLPAFGEFTGGVGVRAEPGDGIFAVAGDEVREVAGLHCPAS
ncbi:MAG: ligase-associated DNA damage response endonuclease PdeM [Betaproteobacteria bacterium]|nr:ligase-associated DNA damage response endonuclease PdeM [Betaproteobacteria bacterium]MCC6250680.1 ligase-associated DNA damage response endonuclease PdeM [Rubrivivax sp.]